MAVAVPVVAILGRPNVGKSTLFNRLVGGRRAIVDDMPGVTRDRLYGEGEWRGRRMVFVDTGGFEPAGTGIMAQVRKQAEQAMADADALVFLVDGKDGLTPTDSEVARLLRVGGSRPILVAVNKIDTAKQAPLAADFARLGFSELFPISAEQGQGIGELLDALLALFPDAAEAEDVVAPTTVAVVGRPNVGKSSLVNRILGAERVVVSDEPGTTRDAVDTRFTYRGRPYLLIDTAGIRAKGRLGRSVERYGVSRALAAVRRADVALVLLDGVEGVTDQDSKIGGEAHEAGCATVLVVNKWDQHKGDADAADVLRGQIAEQFKYLAYAPVAFVSALTGQRVLSLFDFIDEAAGSRARRIPTADLNATIRDAVGRRPPPAEHGRAVQGRYATQTGIKPPTFVLFTTTAGKVHFSYMRYLENAIREAYRFRGSPIRLAIRGRTEKGPRA